MSLTINLNGDVVGTNNGNIIISINSSFALPISSPTFQWNSGVSSPTLIQTANTNVSAVGQNFTIQAQSTTGSGSTAGNLNLAAGTAPTASGTGNVNIQGGAPTSLVNIITFNATDFDADGLVETIGIGSSLVSPRIYQITSSGAGTNLTIQAQNAAGSNNNGGSLVLKGGTATGTGTTGGIVPTVQVRTNTTNTIYTIDSTGGGSDYHILHNNTGTVSYVMPAPTAGRELFLRDITGSINTYGSIPSNVFLVPHAVEKFNTSSGYVMSGTFNITNGSTSVTASSTKAGILAAGMSVVFGTDTKSYIISSFNGTTGITLASSYAGTTNATATGTINSLTFAANYGVLRLVSDGANWYVRGDGTLTYVSFTASGTFITPQGVTFLNVSAFGGGGGGGSGGATSTAANAGGGGGGGGTIQSSTVFSVIPSTSNSITIGAGGTGGAAVTPNQPGNPGTAGGDTIIQNISYINTFLGASGGGGGAASPSTTCSGGLCIRNASSSGNFYNTLSSTSNTIATGTTNFEGTTGFLSVGGGGIATNGEAGSPGCSNITFAPTGTSTGGAVGSSGCGGGAGGGSGPNGPGGNGGTGGTSPVAGTSALANTGGGGGGGGGNSTTSAIGGNGGSGFLYFTYSL